MLINDKSLSAVKKVSKIGLIVNNKNIILKEILSEKKIFETSFNNKYDFIEKKSISLQGKLSGIIKAIEFDKITSNSNIITAINYFKNTSTFTDKAPRKFLNSEEQKIIFDGDNFRISLYKILLFYCYKDFDKYLIPKNEWNEQRNTLLHHYELEHLKIFDTFIKPIKKKLETSTPNSFILKTPKLKKDEEDYNESISKYFPNNEYLSVVDVLDFIDKEVNFLSSFQHYSQSKIKSNHNLLLAAILGYGCNINISKIGKISKGINENQLDNTKTWYFSEENTIEANDKIVVYMDTLDVVKLMKNNQEI